MAVIIKKIEYIHGGIMLTVLVKLSLIIIQGGDVIPSHKVLMEILFLEMVQTVTYHLLGLMCVSLMCIWGLAMVRILQKLTKLMIIIGIK